MNASQRKSVETYIAENLTPRVMRLACLAAWDLYSGPMTFCEECGTATLADCTCRDRYPGFEQALIELREAFDEIGPVYLDLDSEYVCESEPEGFEDDETGVWVEPEPYYRLDRKGLVAAAFGRELAQYL